MNTILIWIRYSSLYNLFERQKWAKYGQGDGLKLFTDFVGRDSEFLLEAFYKV